jgi:diketogulonate reductase-like aldo/keto reductase
MEIPRIGFGCYRIKDQRTFEEAITCGYNHFDTAELYKNEQLVKNAIDKMGDKKIYITTKISKKSITTGRIEESLNERLKIFGKIDLLLLHHPTSNCKKDWEILCVLYLKNKEHIGNIGVSNYDIQHLEQISDCSIKPYCNQIELSPFYTRNKLVSYLRHHNIIIVGHTTLTRSEKFDNETLKIIASVKNTTVANILNQWALQNEYIIIPRTQSVEHMIENKGFSIYIEKDEMELLNSLNEDFFITKVCV